MEATFKKTGMVSDGQRKMSCRSCKIRPGSGSGPSPKFGLRIGLFQYKPKAQARTGLGLGAGPWARAYLVKAQARPEPKPKVYSPSLARARSLLARSSPMQNSSNTYSNLFLPTFPDTVGAWCVQIKLACWRTLVF
jgi:hypothetical protein